MRAAASGPSGPRDAADVDTDDEDADAAFEEWKVCYSHRISPANTLCGCCLPL